MLREYRTKPIDRSQLLAELTELCSVLERNHFSDVAVSFGWDSNIPIDSMWDKHIVDVKDVHSFIARSEQSGLVGLGSGDVFIEAPQFEFLLCHEGDVHVKGSSGLVQQFVHRWEMLGYSPYEVPHENPET